MLLAPGTRIGAYEIVAALGAGGMGEVYRARDRKLDRDVAFKILPEPLSADQERIARFELEGKALAALNHPNIAHIYGVEDADGIRALVMELVEGPTLADRIAQGPIPVDEALPIARQITEALEAAHEHGIIHRDLKPANIKVRGDGTAKVLDFGLAKAREVVTSSGAQLSQSPTRSLQTTEAGIILGTAPYMAPEQARGKTADRRADIWAFGCVLYEMLSGRRAFDGDDLSVTLAAVLKSEPDWRAVPANIPPDIRGLLLQCLQKDPRERLHDIADARITVDQCLRKGSVFAFENGAIPPVLPWWRRPAVPWALASSLFIGLALSSWLYVRGASAPPEIRVDLVTPSSDDPVSFAVSPDGRRLVFVASGDGPSRLWVRSLSTTVAEPLAGTEGGRAPFWSPDSQAIGFWADGRLRRLALGSGRPEIVTSVPGSSGGSWNTDGVMLFAKGFGPLLRVSASGGEAVAVTTLEEGQTSHRWPQFLSDGRRFLFYAAGTTTDRTGIYLGSLDGGAPTRLPSADTRGVLTPSGWLLWERGGTLVAQRLDLERRTLAGSPITVADKVAVGTLNTSAVSASTSGLIAYRSGAANRRQLRHVSRDGTVLGTVGVPDEAGLSQVRISPDGRRVAVSRISQGIRDVWLMDDIRMSRFTSAPGHGQFPVWSPDGSRVVFFSVLNGTANLYIKPANGVGDDELLLASAQSLAPQDWSVDGRFLLYGRLDPQSTWDFRVLPLTGDRKPWPFLNAKFDVREGQFSPDGQWVAYASAQSGTYDIYLRPFVAPGAQSSTDGTAAPSVNGQWPVSTTGGLYPRWSHDGKELFYVRPDGVLMAATLRISRTSVEVAAPVALFQTRISGASRDTTEGWQYDVTRDGGFLINTVVDDAASPITLLMNWAEGKR
jgi:serine/threonine protein kinase/Tol biopolymer transport system component